MPWRPRFEGDFPTLGEHVIDWMESMLSRPGAPTYEPWALYREQIDFILRLYEIDPLTGRRKYTRALLSRVRGCFKSPTAAGIGAAESLADVVFDGWDAHGQPVGKPHREVRRDFKVQFAAVSEEQVDNAWTPLLSMLRDGPVMNEYRIDPMDAHVVVPHGRITPVTASPRSVKGAPNVVLALLDQTEEWVRSNGGVKLAGVMRANAAKTGGLTIETPNAFTPGDNSVAEGSASYAEKIAQGQTLDESLLYDHREAHGDIDLGERESLTLGLRYAYGDASAHPDGCLIHEPPCEPGHVDLDRIIQTIWDPEQDLQQSRADFLGQHQHAQDAWMSRPEWMGAYDPDKVVEPGDVIVLGFDGSRGRARGKADATSLVGCRVSDGHLFLVRNWEQPDGPHGDNWLPPIQDVDQVVRETFEQFKVVGFYADPSHWTEHVARWEARYGRRLKVKATVNAPISLWPRGKTNTLISQHIEALYLAIVNREATHAGDSALTEHVLNARRRAFRGGYLLHKKFPDSRDKIDAAYAAVMAWKCRTDALAKGLGKTREDRSGSRSRSRILT